MAAAARKAWNEAMKATAGAAALPPSLQQNRKRRSDRRKKDNPRSARKATNNNNNNAVQDERASLWMDALEGVDPNASDPLAEPGEGDEEYDELEELLLLQGGEDEDEPGKGKKRKDTTRRKATAVSSKRKKKKTNNTHQLPKRFLPRTAASILLEEASRPDGRGIAQKWLQAQAFHVTHIPTSRSFCPVTGLLGIYKDPKTGIPYATLSALEQIHERAPPWYTLSGTAAFAEAAVSILEQQQSPNENEEQQQDEEKLSSNKSM